MPGLNDDPKPKGTSDGIAETFQDEEKRLYAYAINKGLRALVWVVFIFFGTMTGCSMIGDLTPTLDGKKANLEYEGQAALEEAKAVATRSQIELERSRTEMIGELIDKGVDPLAARCAVVGWDDMSEAAICESFTPKNSVDNPTVDLTINAGETSSEPVSEPEPLANAEDGPSILNDTESKPAEE